MKEAATPGFNFQVLTTVGIENSLRERNKDRLGIIQQRESTVIPMPELVNSRREYFSVFDIPNWQNSFSPISGAIILPGISTTSPYSGFYTRERTHRQSSTDKTTDRGINYYVAMDPIKGKTHDKISSLQDDVISGFELVQQVDRSSIKTPEDFLLHLGVLDYLKNGFSIAFNALNFYEKSGVKNDDPEYVANRRRAEDLAILSNRMFYQSLLGQEYDDGINIDELARQSKDLFAYMKRKEPPVDSDHFRNPENENAVRILQNAYLNAKEHPETTMIIGLLTGGLESAVATQVVFESMYDKSPRLETARVSLHSARRIFKKEMSDATVVEIFKDKDVEGERVLVTDDCVCTGQTLAVVTNALRTLQVADTHVSVTELIPLPLIAEKAVNSNHPGSVVNLANADFATIVGFSPQLDLAEYGERSNIRQIRRLESYDVLAEYYLGKGGQHVAFGPQDSQSSAVLLENLKIKEFAPLP